MISYTQRLLFKAKSIRAMLDHEPEIRLDFARTPAPTVIVLIFCLMWNGVADAASIQQYLHARNCRLDNDTIDMILNQFEGSDRRFHLWERGSIGDYSPILPAMIHWKPQPRFKANC